MYVYSVVILALSGLTLVNSRNLHFMNHVSYKRVHRVLTHANTTVVQGNRVLSQQPDRCGVVALRCYEPILSYMDADGEFCGWKDMTSFFTLPTVCMDIRYFSLNLWGQNVVKYKFKFVKVCDQIQTFQKCVRKNEVCRKNYNINHVLMSYENTFCDNLKVVLPVQACMIAWDDTVNWYKLLYTDWRIVQACPATHYRQLALNSMKLTLFTYITSPSSVTDRVAWSLNGEAAGRYVCQHTQQDMCFGKRGDAVCQGLLPMWASQIYDHLALTMLCITYSSNYGKCHGFVNMMCPINYSNGHMTMITDVADIRNVYNMSYWHDVGNSEVNILLHTYNKGRGHCHAGNLIFKQLGCFHQYIIHMNINHANQGDYLTEYICRNIKSYSSCFEAYIDSSCPNEAKQFQGIGSFLRVQCDILRVANISVTCPLYGAYSLMLFYPESWFYPIMDLMKLYISVIKFKQMDPAPPGWKHLFPPVADNRIRYYKSLFLKAAKSTIASSYESDVISTVCVQDTADLYKHFVTLSTGEQFYQFVNHIIKGFEYIKYMVQ